MNATCPAGISQPQRVSDLGRLLDSEITAPLDSTPAGVVHSPAWRLPLCMAPPSTWRLLLCMAPSSAWRLPLYKAPSSMARALCKAPLINGACSLQSALALGACSLQGALTSPCARGHFIRHTGLRVPSQPKANFLMSVAFPKKRCFLPHLAHVSHLSQPQAGFAWGPAQQDRRRALRVLFGTDDTRFVTRSVRRTKPHTNTQPTAHSQRPARHLHRDPSISYYQRSASAT
jgi:hypothetical protein